MASWECIHSPHLDTRCLDGLIGQTKPYSVAVVVQLASSFSLSLHKPEPFLKIAKGGGNSLL